MPQAGERPLLVCKPKKIEAWRIFKILSEFVEGFDIISRYGLAVSVFGSARAALGGNSFNRAEELAGRLSKKGFAVITGGSTGVMQAANKGAYEAGGASVGLNINLHDVQLYNPYLTEKFGFDHFFVRKVMLMYASEAYVFFPGGFGTLDEFFELVTLVQTKKIRKVPILLFDKDYWEPLTNLIDTMIYQKYSYINKEDMSLYSVVNSVDEAYEYIIANVSC
ncbi:TIGR00730 family Rossman fold protein [Candidatus Kaiserbacteria bacterium]|nr:TIGR00730 family Rossman fold protein [Candidatus Kaiserbacteria bacterium]